MKIYFTIILLCMSYRLLGQGVLEVNTICDNEVSTKWNSSNNENLPFWDHDNNASTPMVEDTRFLNGLDWVNGNTTGNGYSTTNMFFTEGDPYGNMSNVKPLTIPNPWYQYLYFGDDLSPQNGWELVLANLGRYPDNVTSHTFEDKKFTPYIVLYNRYTGVIRVFVTYGKNPVPNDAIDGVKIDLSFALNTINPSDPNSSVSGLLRLGSGMDQALDMNTNVKKMSAVAKNPGEENKWYSADFQVTYDPCTCVYPSRLALQFYWFSETDLKLQGRQITLEEDLTSAQDLVDSDFLGSFEYNADTKDVSNGFVIYKSLEKSLDDYIAQMEKYEQDLQATNEHNAKVKRNKAIAKAFKAVIIAGVSATSAGVGGVAISAALSGGAAWATDFVNNAGDLIEKDTVKFYTLEKETKKLLGSQFDFLIDKNFKEKPGPTKPNEPTVAYSEMNFKGKLTNEFAIPGPDFMAPGTFDNGVATAPINLPLVYKYPVYNDILGIFALLETPYVRVSDDIQNHIAKDITYVMSPSSTSPSYSRYQSWTNNYQIKLGSDLKYALNTNLDIKNYSIQAAFVIRDSIIEGEYPTLPESGYQHCFTDPSFNTNLNSLNSDVNVMERIYSMGDFQNGNEFNVPPPYIAIQNFHPDQSVFKKRTRTFETDFVPKDAFYEKIYEFGVKNERISTPSTSTSGLVSIVPENYGFKHDLYIELKIMLEMEFNTLNQHGENNKLTQVFTYVIPQDHYINETQDIYPNLHTSGLNFGQYSENLTFTGTTFNGSAVAGCKLNGSTYECRAKNNIWISGNITANNGYSVRFRAGNEIYRLPESTLNGEIVEEIIPINDFSHPMPQSTTAQITSFCSGTNGQQPAYKANVASKSVNISQSDSQIVTDVAVSDWNVEMYPNPTNGITQLELINMNSDQVTILIMDVTGKVIDNTTHITDDSHIEVNLSDYRKGIYFIQMKTNQGTKTKQLVLN